MLRLPRFSHHQPSSLAEATALLSELIARGESVKLIAGGTDLLPNMKHEITTPQHVVSLAALPLRGARLEGAEVVLGALTSVHDVSQDPLVQKELPALAEACGLIAGPQLRRMGTLGGNVCLDTRCLYINQTHFWRRALGYCLKKDGTVCHVVAGGQNCVAAAQNDSALPLLLYGAQVELVGPRGTRRIDLDDFFIADGIKNTVIEADEILTEVRVPRQAKNVRCTFEKLRVRRSIDFALVNLAALSETDGAGQLLRLEVMVGSLGAKPKRLNLDSLGRGKTLDAALIEAAAKKAFAACRPLTNLATDPDWRRAMVPVLVRKALRRLAGVEGRPGHPSQPHPG